VRFQTSQQNSACKFCLQRDLRDRRYAWKSVHFTKCRRHYLVQLQEGCPVPSPFRTRWFRRITTILVGLGNNCGYGEFGYPPPLGARTCPQLSARLRARAGISVLSIRPKSTVKNFTPVLRLQPLLPKIPLVPVKILSTIPRS
jgi:hypothetical protein